MASLESDNLVVFYYVRASEICSEIREVTLGGSGLIREGLLFPSYVLKIDIDDLFVEVNKNTTEKKQQFVYICD